MPSENAKGRNLVIMQFCPSPCASLSFFLSLSPSPSYFWNCLPSRNIHDFGKNIIIYIRFQAQVALLFFSIFCLFHLPLFDSPTQRIRVQPLRWLCIWNNIAIFIRMLLGNAPANAANPPEHQPNKRKRHRETGDQSQTPVSAPEQRKAKMRKACSRYCC